jgi:hypothetical protein
MSERFVSIIVRANHMLAVVTCGRAARLWQSQDMSRAGAELKAAAQYAEDAAQWLGNEFASGVCAAASAARAAGAKLEVGNACTADEINDVLIALRAAIDSIPHRFSLKEVP